MSTVSNPVSKASRVDASRILIPRADRWAALLRLTEREGHLDVVNQAAVNDYVDTTGAPCSVMPYGAAKCPLMGRDLAGMAEAGLLVRHRTGLQGMAGMGFPRWVWSYQLAERGSAPEPQA